MTRLRFTKMHGIGNDYVYIDCFTDDVADPAGLARQLSPRRTGVGADGLILIRPSTVADCRMDMYNADGSRGEMCGNGIRCVAKYAYEHGHSRANPLRIETDAGVKTVQLHLRNERVEQVTVDMGVPIFDGPQIPVAATGEVVDLPLDVEGEMYRVTCLSMGNPHCVVFVPNAVILDLELIGPRFEYHSFFPQRVNAEFVQVLSPREFKMRVWERGSGETAACGTGACAALVAAVLNHGGESPATVHLRGGDLVIEWRRDDHHVYMTGGATQVFTGEVEMNS